MSGPGTLSPGAVESRVGTVRVGSAALVSVALLGVNGLAYAFTVLAARTLAPAAFGELAALTGLLLVGTVPGSALQTVAALWLDGARGDRRALTERLHVTALAGGLVVGAAGLGAVPLVVALLHLPDPAAALWAAALLLPHTLVGGYDGVLQGSRRYGRLAVVAGLFGVTKVGGAATGLLLGGTPAAALAGMAAGSCLGALAGWVGCGRPGLRSGIREPARAALRAAGALLGFILLVNLDVLLARHHLPAAAAGDYAVAAVFTKIAFWLPQGVGTVLLPGLADADRRRRTVPAAVGLVAGVGALLTAGVAALGAAALPLVGGASYGAALGRWAWAFTVLGTLLAVTQLLLYSGLAAADRVAPPAVWAAAIGECTVVELLAATGRLNAPALVAAAIGTVVLLAATGLRRLRPDGAAPPRPRPAGRGTDE